MTTPTAVNTNLFFSAIYAGGGHTCGLTRDGTAYCWGFNQYGQIGDGSTENRDGPRQVQGGLGFDELALGPLHTCGLTSVGDAYCWGRNGSGQLGTGSTQDSDTPVAVIGGLSFTDLFVGDLHTCGVASDGSIYCWGSVVLGRLGIGSTFGPDNCGFSFNPPTCSTAPIAVDSPLRYLALADDGNYAHVCAVTLDRRAYCWGPNQSGQVGSVGSLHQRPVRVLQPNRS